MKLKPLLFAGSHKAHKDFLERYEMSPMDVPLVVETRKLYGHEGRTLIYGGGFDWVAKDKIIAGYCRTHDIAMMSDIEFSKLYITNNIDFS